MCLTAVRAGPTMINYGVSFVRQKHSEPIVNERNMGTVGTITYKLVHLLYHIVLEL